jgi:hypothetical protein
MDTQFLSAKKKTEMILKNLNLLCLNEKPKIREKMERMKQI